MLFHAGTAVIGNAHDARKTILNTTDIIDADGMQDRYCKAINPIPPEEC
jgi:hypothetical protein